MTDLHHSALAEIKQTGLRPRRYRGPALLLRQLVWPVLRAWFFHGVQQTERLATDAAALRLQTERLRDELARLQTLMQRYEADSARLRQQAEAERAATAQARQQIDTLQATLAEFTIERSFFEASIRTELMAVTNVVDCYRDVVEPLPPAAPRRAARTATRVYVHGNCQGTALAVLLRDARPDWRIDGFEVFQDPAVTQDGAHRRLAAEADIIVAQPVSDGYRGRDDLSLSWLRAACRPGCTVVTFPSMYFDGQLLGQHSLGFPGVTCGYHDVVLAALAMTGAEPEAALDLLLAEDRYGRGFLLAEIDRSLAELRGREAREGVDIRVSPFLAEHAESAQLFHVANHPQRAVLVAVARLALAQLGVPALVPDAGPDPLPMPHLPLLPSVARFMRPGWEESPGWAIPDADRYRVPDVMTRREGARREYEFYCGMDRAALAAALHGPRVQRFLRDAAQAGQIPAALPASGAASVHRFVPVPGAA